MTETPCERSRNGYCTVFDTQCNYIHREYGCAVYRHDMVERNVIEQTKKYNILLKRELSIEQEGEMNE